MIIIKYREIHWIYKHCIINFCYHEHTSSQWDWSNSINQLYSAISFPFYTSLKSKRQIFWRFFFITSFSWDMLFIFTGMVTWWQITVSAETYSLKLLQKHFCRQIYMFNGNRVHFCMLILTQENPWGLSQFFPNSFPNYI